MFDPTELFALLPQYAKPFIECIRLGQFEKRTDLRMRLFSCDDCSKEMVVDDLRLSAAETFAASGSDSKNLIAVLPIKGTTNPDGRYGGTSTNALASWIARLDADPNVSNIVLDITSPGGTVTGTMEAADAVRKVRDGGRTYVTAVANGMMASAATWIGTAANEVVITPSGEAGSIGVISMYADMSKMYEDAGIKVDVMRTPAGKARFTGIEPLSDEMRQTMQMRLDQSYGQFKRAMADNRKVRVDTVEAKFGGGEMMNAEEAMASGLVDRIGTFDAVMNGLMHRKRKAPASAMARVRLAELE